MLDDFFIRAIIAGLGVAVAAGPLGCFVVWRRMAYFGDATAHAALLGVVFSLATGLPVVAGVTLTALAMALTVSAASGRTLAMDTMLGVMSHAALATGLVAASFLPGARFDLTGFLFGDILAVSPRDLLIIWSGAMIVTGLLIRRWRPLLLSTLNEDLAVSAGIRPDREKLVLTLALALLVAVALKVVGVLLITAMLIIPAASARTVASTPASMAFLATGFAALAAVAGLFASLQFDTPAGPSIVTAGAGILLILNVFSSVRRVRTNG